jgi:hypothetical protein
MIRSRAQRPNNLREVRLRVLYGTGDCTLETHAAGNISVYPSI